MALFYNMRRTASIRAEGVCYLWGIERNTFRKALEEMKTKKFEDNRKLIEKMSFFCKNLSIIL